MAETKQQEQVAEFQTNTPAQPNTFPRAQPFSPWDHTQRPTTQSYNPLITGD